MKKAGALGLAAAALLLAAWGATPAEAKYHAEPPPTVVAGAQVAQNTFTTMSGSIKCEVVTVSGAIEGSAEELPLGLTTEKCKAFGLAATVTPNGCQVSFGKTTTTEKGFHAPVQVLCPAGKAIVANAGAGGCVVEVGEQLAGGVAKLENQGEGKSRDFLATWELSGIKYSQAGTKCTGGNGTFTNGTLTGTVTVKGSDGGGQLGVWVDASGYNAEPPPTVVAGAQVAQNTFTTMSGSIKCEVVTVSGAIEGSAEELPLGLTTEKCKAFGLAATVTPNGCQVSFGKTTTTEKGFHAPVQVLCPAGKAIVANAGAGGCVVEVGEQLVGGVAKLENQGEGKSRDFLTTWELSGIKYAQAGTKCTGGNGTFTNGTLTGTVTVKGSDGEGQLGAWVE